MAKVLLHIPTLRRLHVFSKDPKYNQTEYIRSANFYLNNKDVTHIYITKSPDQGDVFCFAHASSIQYYRAYTLLKKRVEEFMWIDEDEN